MEISNNEIYDLLLIHLIGQKSNGLILDYDLADVVNDNVLHVSIVKSVPMPIDYVNLTFTVRK